MARRIFPPIQEYRRDPSTVQKKLLQLTSNGVAIDTNPAVYGELKDSSSILGDPDALRSRMEEDGYLYMAGLLDRQLVLEARREILLKYATVGEIDSIDHDLMDGVYSSDSAIGHVNLRAFTESVRTGRGYEGVVLNPGLFDFLAVLIGSHVKAFDFRWPRFVRPGEGCGFHMDGPYMNRGTSKIYTTWIPIGDVPRSQGSLILLERSHRNEELLSTYAQQDADVDLIDWLSYDPNELQRRIGGRWLTTDFEAGDVLCFGMHMLHGALDNNNQEGRCRLSSDTRYQSADEPFDQRWNGQNPEAHGYDKVFLPGLGSWNNHEFLDEWKRVDQRGRLVLD